MSLAAAAATGHIPQPSWWDGHSLAGRPQLHANTQSSILDATGNLPQSLRRAHVLGATGPHVTPAAKRVPREILLPTLLRLRGKDIPEPLEFARACAARPQNDLSPALATGVRHRSRRLGLSVTNPAEGMIQHGLEAAVQYGLSALACSGPRWPRTLLGAGQPLFLDVPENISTAEGTEFAVIVNHIGR